MFTKIRIILAVVLIAVAIFYTVREGHAENTNPVDSMQILTDIYMKMDFSDAARLRMEKDEDSFKQDYYKMQKNLIASGLVGMKPYVSDDQLQRLADAQLEMNKKRVVQVEIVSQEEKKARVKVTISTYDKQKFDEKVMAAMQGSFQQTTNMQQASAAAIDAIVGVYQTFEPKDTTKSFEIDCEKYTLSTRQIGRAAWLDRLISGTCWLPSDMKEYARKLKMALL